MSQPVIADPVLSGRRQQGGKPKSTSFLSFPVVLMIACGICGLPPIASRLWAVDSSIHAHNDAIVSVLMVIGPFFLIALAALGIFMFIRAGQAVEVESDTHTYY